jgi:hypothetical protein
VVKVEMTFYSSGGWESGGLMAGGYWWCCEFNTLVSARKGRQWDKILSEGETDATTSSLLNGKEV